MQNRYSEESTLSVFICCLQSTDCAFKLLRKSSVFVIFISQLGSFLIRRHIVDISINLTLHSNYQIYSIEHKGRQIAE